MKKIILSALFMLPCLPLWAGLENCLGRETKGLEFYAINKLVGKEGYDNGPNEAFYILSSSHKLYEDSTGILFSFSIVQVYDDDFGGIYEELAPPRIWIDRHANHQGIPLEHSLEGWFPPLLGKDAFLCQRTSVAGTSSNAGFAQLF